MADLSATGEVTRVGYNLPDRRPSHDAPEPQDPPPAPLPAPPAAEAADRFSLDVAFYANRFRADLSQLGETAEPHENEAEATDARNDPALFDFFGNLNVLLLAVRSGDLQRARAAAAALEMEVLIERSAGRTADPAAPQRLGDFGRLFGAVPKLASPTVAPVLALAPAPPPPDPYGELGAEEGGAADDALAPYFDAEARV